MNEKRLAEWYRSRREEYSELAEKCGSVPELMFKLEVYGDKWTKWDWVMFLSYLDFTVEFVDRERLVWSPWRQAETPDDSPEKNLLEDMFRELDSGSRLDGVLTNRTVIMNLIEWLGAKGVDAPRRKYGLLRLLAHVFAKFPGLWTMNWMFVRHRGRANAGRKTHRLAYALPRTAGRPERYFGSKAFLEDFVSRYWGERGVFEEEGAGESA